MFLLVLYSRDAALAGLRIELDPARPLSLGRDITCAVSIRSQGVSRHHARVEAVDGGWRLVDQSSTNGTLVNGIAATTTHLDAGDRIQIGDTILRMCSDDEPPLIVETEQRATSFDGPTGLFNRLRLLEELRVALQTGARPLALLRFNVEGMRAFNDAHGHVAGDKLLVSLASRLRWWVGFDEIFVRYGGDEFVVAILGADLAAARARAAALCAKLATDHALSLGGCSVSVGAAEASANTRAEELLHLAEDDLLASRRRG